MTKIYIVTFEIHKDCQIRNFVYHCNANNAKDACMQARECWNSKNGHQFHVHAVRSKIQDPSLLQVRNWRGLTQTGRDIMYYYIMLDAKTWRYKASDGTYRYPLCSVY
jgi:hypothetical protein